MTIDAGGVDGADGAKQFPAGRSRHRARLPYGCTSIFPAAADGGNQRRQRLEILLRRQDADPRSLGDRRPGVGRNPLDDPARSALRTGSVAARGA